ncbi:MAG: alpha/beta hydrolase family esterase [Pseudomonadota bacterium]
MCVSLAAAADTTTHQIKVGELDRNYLLYLPGSHDPGSKSKYPVVINLHGGGGNARSILAMSGMNELAEQEGFIVVYPNGTGQTPNRNTFNGGLCCAYAMQNKIDDVAFVVAILDELEARYAADPARVYATGLSNGGIMSHYLASNLASRITAIAPVAGTIGINPVTPSRPVPVMHMHGTEDKALPWIGGYNLATRRTNFISVDETIKAWVLSNNSEIIPVVERFPDTADDNCRVEKYTYAARAGNGENSAEVILIKLIGGGHTWPDAARSSEMLGNVCRDINANRVMWEFFKQYAIQP